MKGTTKALYRKWNDHSKNSSKCHKLDGTNIRAKFKVCTQKRNS